MKKIVYLGSKEIGVDCLNVLLKLPDAEVIALGGSRRSIGDSGTSVLEIAEKEGIPVLNHSDDIPDCDLILSVQYHDILKDHHLNRASVAAVNLHMAPLPEYRGCNQFSFAILDKAREFGATLHLMDEGIDSGAVLFEKRFRIPENCNVVTLYQMTLDTSKELFENRIQNLLSGNFTPVYQESLVQERGTALHFRKEIETIKKIDLNWSDEQIDRHVRATYFPPFPPPYLIHGNQKVDLDLNWRKQLQKIGLR